MSAMSDAMRVVKDVLKMTDDVKRAGETLKDVALELREHDRRITRLEAKWETALELSTPPRGRRRLPPPDEG
jgi:hypothetical protein